MASAALALGVSLGAASPLRAEPPPEPVASDEDRAELSRTHFRRGRELAAEGDAAGAIASLERACELDSNPNALFLLAELKHRTGDEMGALEAFERYLALGDEPGSAGRRDVAERRVRELGGRAARLEVRVNVEGAKITVDDRPAGEAPLAKPLRIAPGEHRVRVEAPGRAAHTRQMSAAPGESCMIAVDLLDENDARRPMVPGGEAPGPRFLPHACGCEVPGAPASGGALSALAAAAALALAAGGRRRAGRGEPGAPDR